MFSTVFAGCPHFLLRGGNSRYGSWNEVVICSIVVFVLAVAFTTEKGAFMPGLSVLVEAACKRKRKTAADASQDERQRIVSMRAANPRCVVADELKKLTPEEQTRRRAELRKARRLSCPCVPLASHACCAGSWCSDDVFVCYAGLR